MLKRYHQTIGGLFRAVDACVIGGAWLLSYWLRAHLPYLQVSKNLPVFSTYLPLLPLIVVLWTTVFSAAGAYQSRKVLRRTDEATLILKAHFIAMLFFIAVAYLFNEYKYSRGVLVYFGFLGGFLLVSCRLLMRNILRALSRRGFNLQDILAIGEGSSLENLVQRLDRFPELGYRVIGVITHHQSKAQQVAGKPVIGHFGQTNGQAGADLEKTLRQHRFDQLLIALPKHQYADLDQVLHAIHQETIDIRLVPDIHEYVTLGCAVEDFDGFPVVNLNHSPLEGWGAILKRLTDIILSFFALVVLAPLLLVISLLVKLTSRGPVFYSQERMGMDGRLFKMHKFRSMRWEPEGQGSGWTTANDPRRTRFGSFLRATSLDELPQFWNVLMGDMSLVGPRPEQAPYVQKFRSEIPNYMLRHKVKAGITGWAQVNGWRGDTSLNRRIEFDLYYIRNWSYVLDIKILVLTFWKGFINRNAY